MEAGLEPRAADALCHAPNHEGRLSRKLTLPPTQFFSEEDPERASSQAVCMRPWSPPACCVLWPRGPAARPCQGDHVFCERSLLRQGHIPTRSEQRGQRPAACVYTFQRFSYWATGYWCLINTLHTLFHFTLKITPWPQLLSSLQAKKLKLRGMKSWHRDKPGGRLQVLSAGLSLHVSTGPQSARLPLQGWRGSLVHRPPVSPLAGRPFITGCIFRLCPIFFFLTYSLKIEPILPYFAHLETTLNSF